MTTTSSTQQQLTLNKIGNFVGTKVRELLDLISGKADRAEVDALPRFREAASASEMLTLDGVRVGDFCLRLDSGSGYRLTAFPANSLANWRPVFSASTTITRSVPFAAAVAPVITHEMNRVPSSVAVIDSNGRLNVVDWKPVDMDSIQLYFTESVSGVCNLTFAS